MHKRLDKKPLGVMDRRVQKSDKYAHVKGTLNTGMTVDKVQIVTAREYSKRRDEIFFRLKKMQMAQLYDEYEAEDYEQIQHSPDNRGGEPRIVTYDQFDEPEYEKPYLILDCRSAEEFNQCHLLRARSFPYAMLRRDQLHPEVYKFRNKAESLIILYCDDEKISREAAKVMVDRGTDNIFVLTGGIIEFAGDYAQYVEGVHPEHERVMAAASATKSRTQTRSRLTSLPEDAELSSPGRLTPRKLDRHNDTLGSSGRAGASSNGSNSRAGGPPLSQHSRLMARAQQSLRSDCGESTASTSRSVAESVISRASARKGKF